jgi:hypothetical protein
MSILLLIAGIGAVAVCIAGIAALWLVGRLAIDYMRQTWNRP